MLETPSSLSYIQRRLEAIRQQHLLRRLSAPGQPTEPWITIDSRKLLNLSSNNYLGLAQNPRLKQAAAKALELYGCSAASSRLIAGTTAFHAHVEARLASLYHCEAALLFSSGYTANVGVISGLVGPGDVVLSDELNHASIIDGCRLSKAERRIYPHCNVHALAQHLEELERQGQRGMRLVVTESVFSMDGDIAPLAEIASLCRQHQALLFVDEAHATGCLGPNGRGLLSHLGLEQEENIVAMHSFSKALGSIGAFVTSHALIKDLLVNVSRQFIFTTASPVATLAAGLTALEVLNEQPDLPTQLQNKAAFLRHGLQELGLNTLASETQIIPWLIGDSERALQIAAALLGEGIYALAIRPPTVPRGAARIRFSVMASHTEQELARALEAVATVCKNMQFHIEA
ncbi:8-amino-7-oxononanoate synthase [Ktedonosporobacter rubrisoli]|uniref:8-amino-7-oxononanoate synthase n=1 Tax=Ktedonosporobacter rubrisoli TaxID=2509675 RepID=A0A4P6JJU3_KTERU|nr:8-amino-7-oxononanoate synthase [Ktedonosporobacter rubrisoli]QBD75222.1 8-amino-7-oxononanoate synthase [Ktedonosporobacter rubrisoli]